jgi:hypothetical protein
MRNQVSLGILTGVTAATTLFISYVREFIDVTRDLGARRTSHKISSGPAGARSTAARRGRHAGFRRASYVGCLFVMPLPSDT